MIEGLFLQRLERKKQDIFNVTLYFYMFWIGRGFPSRIKELSEHSYCFLLIVILFR